MDKDKLKSIIESLLFAYGEKLNLTTLSQILEIDEYKIKEAIEELKSDYQNNSRGIQIVEIASNYQLTTKSENFPYIEKLIKKDFSEELTPASLEVLTIILYRYPVPRAEIDFIRGVNSSFILRSLLLRGLIDKTYSREKNANLYSPSFELFKLLGIKDKLNLPDFEKLNKKLEELIINEELPNYNE